MVAVKCESNGFYIVTGSKKAPAISSPNFYQPKS